MKRKLGMVCLAVGVFSLFVLSFFAVNVPVVQTPTDVPKGEKLIALTFDDGPNEKTTGEILDALESADAKATFFVLGQMAEKTPQTLQRMEKLGCEIGNHSYSHAKLINLSKSDFEKEINKTDDIISQAVGHKSTLLRPTYGAYNSSVRSYATTPLVLWSVDTEDWSSKNTDRIVEHVLSHVKDGSVILMHDIYPSTAAAVKILIPKLQAEGYTLVTVSELYRLKGKEMTTGLVYGTM